MFEIQESHYMDCRSFQPSGHWLGSDNTIHSHQYKKSINEQFLLLEPELELTQVIDFPTRGSNILDLFLTNRPQIINRCTAIPGISDHYDVFVNTNMSSPKCKPPKRTLCMWNKANINSINLLLILFKCSIIFILKSKTISIFLSLKILKIEWVALRTLSVEHRSPTPITLTR